jgi:hypothetical protein
MNTGTGIDMPSIKDEDLDYLDDTNALNPADLEAYNNTNNNFSTVCSRKTPLVSKPTSQLAKNLKGNTSQEEVMDFPRP